jgi:ABC-type hemin transport system ATPase subunit
MCGEAAIAATGPVAEVLTSEAVSATFGVDVRVGVDAGRWCALISR